MTKLTEDMVIARTKTSDLGAVKKFNCWGSDLSDVSLVRKLVNVEVLSLSLNKITTLVDFQFCRNLTELYVRRNEIRDLCELCYLQDLPRLKRLLLSENPGVETLAGPLYRATVLRCLPNLETLDNQPVTPDEVEAAARTGLILEHPLHRRERGSSPEQPNCYYERESPPPTNLQGSRRSLSQYDYEDDSPPYRQQQHQNHGGPTHSPDYQYHQNGGSGNKSPDAGSTQVMNGNVQRSPPPPPLSSTNNPTMTMTTTITATPPELLQQDQRSQSPPPTTHSPGTLPRRASGSPIIDCYQQQYRDRDMNGSRRQSVDYSGDTLRNYENYYDDQLNHRQQVQVIPTQRHPPIPSNRTKPRTKTSNILSAVLCLIPSLDMDSLEVIELAVKRRMNELDQ